MCNCIKGLQDKLREKLSGDEAFGNLKPKIGNLRFIIVKNAAFQMSSGDFKLNIPFTASWDTGKDKLKEIDIPVIASHCPFCGVELAVKESSPQTA